LILLWIVHYIGDKMELKSCKKQYMKDTHRAVPPEDTLRIVKEKLAVCGITRVADITDLDRLGIPVFSAVRPNASLGSVSVYNGKGVSKTEAEVSAIMEGIERYSSEINEEIIMDASLSEIEGKVNFLSPYELNLPAPEMFNEFIRIGWVKGYDLFNKEDIFVPANSVFHPYPLKRDYPIFRTNTNGLASGNTLEEAIFHGLCEVIERDAWSLVEMKRTFPKDLEIEINDPLLEDFLNRFKENEIEIIFKDITSDIQVPTILAAVDDLRLKDPTLLVMGMGTHIDPKVAIYRAITEAAQSRLTQIHGAREDTQKADMKRRIGYERIRRLNWYYINKFDIKTKTSDFVLKSSDDILEDINTLLNVLSQRGINKAIVVDLTRKELGIPVVRVLVPQLEQYGIDNSRIGSRGRMREVDKNYYLFGPKPSSR